MNDESQTIGPDFDGLGASTVYQPQEALLHHHQHSHPHDVHAHDQAEYEAMHAHQNHFFMHPMHVPLHTLMPMNMFHDPGQQQHPDSPPQQHHQGFMFPPQHNAYHHNQGFHPMQNQHHSQRFIPSRDFPHFSAPVPMGVIEGGGHPAQPGMQSFHQDGNVVIHPDFGHQFISPNMPHAMMGMVGVGLGQDVRYDRRPDSPNAWWGVDQTQGMMENEHGHVLGGVEQHHHHQQQHDHGIMISGGVNEDEMEQMAASASAAAAIAAQGQFMIPTPEGQHRGMGGMSGAVHEDEGVFHHPDVSTSSSQDGESQQDKNLRRGKGAVYCVHRKLLHRCSDCSTLNNPSHVITRVSAVCHHGKRRSQCIQCYDEGTGGSIICEHRRQKYACPKCFDEGKETNSLCLHRTIKFKCKICSPSIHQPKTYKKRQGSKANANNDSEAPYTKKRANSRTKKDAAGNHGGVNNGFAAGGGMSGHDESMGGGMHLGPQMYYASHHPMIGLSSMNQHQQMPQSYGNGTGQAPGYMFATGPTPVPLVPVIQPASFTSDRSFIATPIPTRSVSPELNKMAGAQATGFVAAAGGGVQYLVPTMVPLPYQMQATSTALLTPTVSPINTNASIAATAAPLPPMPPKIGALSPYLSPVKTKAISESEDASLSSSKQVKFVVSNETAESTAAANVTETDQDAAATMVTLLPSRERQSTASSTSSHIRQSSASFYFSTPYGYMATAAPVMMSYAAGRPVMFLHPATSHECVASTQEMNGENESQEEARSSESDADEDKRD